MTYNNIPAELRELPQWVVWAYDANRLNEAGKPTKQPFNVAGGLADVTNPFTWTTFDNAVNALSSGWYNGIGFVFTERDPFVFIDLDPPKCAPDEYDAIMQGQRRIAEQFADTYAEVSPSGNGLHIIAKGAIISAKKRSRLGVELYSKERFGCFTGNVYHNQPVVDKGGLIHTLWQELGGDKDVNTDGINAPQTADDRAIYDRAANAKNGELFLALWNGQFAGRFPSQSEADQALMNMLAFYTQNREQLERLFLASALGQRDKAKRRDYMQATIARSLDRAVDTAIVASFTDTFRAKVDAIIAAEKAALEQQIAEARARAQADLAQRQQARQHAQTVAGGPFALVPALGEGQDFAAPPGLLGEIARFAYAQAPYPNPRIALASAIGFLSGLCGRAYNVNGMGVNLYTLLIAPTATGKEAMSSAISKLAMAMRPTVPSIMQYFGVDHIASGQALYKKIKERKCFLSVQSEFGIELQNLTHPRAPAPVVKLKQAYLQLFTKSGRGQFMGGSVFADGAKDTDILEAPGFSILGETAPVHLYDNLSETMLSDGFLPRFTIIEVDQPTSEYNRTANLVQPPQELLAQLVDVATFCLKCDQLNVAQEIMFAPDADQLSEAYREASKASADFTTRDSIKQLWSRAHAKALKLAGLLAIGANPFAPTVTHDLMTWAIQLTNDGIKRLSRKFEVGDVGTGDERCLAELRKLLARYTVDPVQSLPQATLKREQHARGIISYTYIRTHLQGYAAFRGAVGGAGRALRDTIQAAIDCGHIVELSASKPAVPNMPGRQEGSGKNFAIIDADIAHYHPSRG